MSSTPVRKPQAPSARKLTCFIMSPIGPDGSEVREHSDDIRDLLVTRAIELLNEEGFNFDKPKRGDQVFEAGRIMDQVLHSILKADLIVCLLTYSNPNVYYELGIAHAAGRPVLLLAKNGEVVPFDLQQDRMVRYDYKPRPLATPDTARKIAEAIKEIMKQPRYVKPLGQDLDRLGGQYLDFRFHPQYKFNPKDQSGISFEDFVSLFRDAQEFIAISEPALEIMHSMKAPVPIRVQTKDGIQDESVHLHKELLSKAGAGCHVFIVRMSPDNKALAELKPTRPDPTGAEKPQEASFQKGLDELVKAKHPNVHIQTLAAGVIQSHVIMNEGRAIYMPHLYGDQAWGDKPCIGVRRESPFFRIIADQIRFLQRLNGLDELPHIGQARNTVETGPTTSINSEGYPFDECIDAISRAEKSLVIAEPNFELMRATLHIEDDAEHRHKMLAAIGDAAKRGCRVDLLVMQPNRTRLQEYIGTLDDEAAARIGTDHELTLSHWEHVAARVRNTLRVRILQREPMPKRIVLSEKEVIIIDPVLKIRADTPCSMVRHDTSSQVYSVTQDTLGKLLSASPAQPSKPNSTTKGDSAQPRPNGPDAKTGTG